LGRELLPETAVFAWLSTLCAPLLLLNRRNNCWNSFAGREQTEHPTKHRKRIQIIRKTIEPIQYQYQKKESKNQFQMARDKFIATQFS
jgi:hypothetical protein